MSSGFTLGTDTYWGSNGAIATYIAVMADLAVGRFGAQDPLAVRLTQEHEFRRTATMGSVVLLDDWLQDAESRARLCWLLDAATDQILHQGTFTDAGREWIATVVTRLKARIARCTF